MIAAIWILGILSVLSLLALIAAVLLTHAEVYREGVDDRESLYDGENFI